jgi:hypothetical protein
VREGVPEEGDLRHPTLGGTIFVGVFLGLAAAVLSMWRDWHLAVHPCGADLHLPPGGNLIPVRINKHREDARAVVDDLIADRERASLAAGRRSAGRASKSSRSARRVCSCREPARPGADLGAPEHGRADAVPSFARRACAAGAVAVGEDGKAGRHLDSCVRRRWSFEVLAVVVTAHRGADGGGDPVDGQVGQELVRGGSRFDLAATIAEGGEEVDDPRGQSCGRVDEPVRDGLRFRGLHPGVGDIVGAFARVRLDELAHRGRPRLRGWVEVEGAEVEADQMPGMPKAELGRHTRTWPCRSDAYQGSARPGEPIVAR